MLVDAGLRVVRAEGADALTMRRVAAELDTAAGSLYVYVANRGELLGLMVDAALGAVDVQRHPRQGWRLRLARLLTDEIRALGSYPGLGLHIAASIPVSENALACAELELALLLEGGASRQQAGWAIALLGSYVANAAIEAGLYHEQALAGDTETDTVAAARDVFAALPQERFPLLHGMVDSLFAGDDDDRQQWAIDVLIAGILGTAATPKHAGE